MTSPRPEPLVPAEVDLRGLGGFMLRTDRLLSSELVALGTPEECWAAVLLWCRAWQQKPAASLPDDDRILASFSGTGKRWSKVKAMAMRGFVLCSDGRWYHRVLAEEAREAWDRRVKFRERSAKANKARHGAQQAEQQGLQQGADATLLQGANKDSYKTTKGSEGKGSKSIKPESSAYPVSTSLPSTSPGRDATPPDGQRPETPKTDTDRSPPDSPSIDGRPTQIAVLLRSLGVAVNAAHPSVQSWSCEGVTDAQLREAVAQARTRKPDPQPIPPGYLVPIVSEIRNPPAVKSSGPGWWETDELTLAEGKRLGIAPNRGEDWTAFRQRIRGLQQREKAAA